MSIIKPQNTIYWIWTSIVFKNCTTRGFAISIVNNALFEQSKKLFAHQNSVILRILQKNFRWILHSTVIESILNCISWAHCLELFKNFQDKICKKSCNHEILDETGESAAQQRYSFRLKKDTSFSWSVTDPELLKKLTGPLRLDVFSIV